MSPDLIPLLPTHAALLAGLHHICFAEPWNEAAMAGLLAMPGSYGFLAASAGQPRGFILCRIAADEAEVLTLLVLPPERRAGLAKALLKAAAEQAAADGAGRFLLEVAADNNAALALYRDQGFAPVGRRKNYYGGRLDALILERRLQEERSVLPE
ncbi:MAG TPA: GNAT family N-acetyltransferase [Rhodospirillaceae bacterium]|nr:GNAT family N-acetyltransferase [Rhodospirillaceae bacterium]